ncbi:probable 3-beta-hydroxysteroid-Delta(8),Delta(7)-isomerase [Andrographis paniculata]|uniref:probable 3-beta-hydroxysteroid-Delta(8),Delta(7)-isomerase n=1 Tax=Andrographis paniculata TaxID=175694 RepID=UPI0021E8E2A6|nr:probable 3-beta-hydroxysteroid-Delta(8),Delta(7)-isomerase [Andrographis paniculata]
MATHEHDHPYVPRDMKLPGYMPPFLPQDTIVGIYGAASLLVVSIMWILSGRCRKISKGDRLLMCWWVFTGLTHMVLEGYFVFSPQFYKKTTPHYLADVWKEYSKGDSRYAGRDSAVVAVEGITAVLEGPACLLAAYAIATKKPYEHILQVAISLGQLYGTIVYFVTSLLDGDNFAASAFYYYAYYVFANGWWVLIPSIITVRCWKKICAAYQESAPVQTRAKAKGKAKTG